MLRLQNQVRELQAEQELILERKRQELRKEMLPQEQLPEVAKSLSQIFQGANLSFVGEASPLLSALTPVLSMLGQSCAPMLNGRSHADRAG